MTTNLDNEAQQSSQQQQQQSHSRSRKRKNLSAQDAEVMDKELERLALLAVENIKREMSGEFGARAQPTIRQQQAHLQQIASANVEEGAASIYAVPSSNHQNQHQAYELNVNNDPAGHQHVQECESLDNSGQHQQGEMDSDAPGNLSWLMSFKLDSLFPEEALDLDGANNNLAAHSSAPAFGQQMVHKNQQDAGGMKDSVCSAG
jgi:hypothetical protein